LHQKLYKLENYVNPVPTYYAAARLAIHTGHLLITIHSIAHL